MYVTLLSSQIICILNIPDGRYFLQFLANHEGLQKKYYIKLKRKKITNQLIFSDNYTILNVICTKFWDKKV